MSIAKSSTETKPVGPRFNRKELKKLDAQRAQLGGISRAGAVKLMWANMGDDALARAQRTAAAENRIEDGAVAQSVGHLTEELAKLEVAFNRYAHQRRAIGVHTNQLAKLANVLQLMIREGRNGEVEPELVESLVHALDGVRDELEAQKAIESADDGLRRKIRDLIKSVSRR